MKNKILALVLALIIALSSTSAFAAEQVYYTNFNIYDLLRNYGSYYFEPADTNGNVQTNTYTEKAPVDYTAETNQAPSNERATSETRTNTSAAPSVSNYERQVVELVNIERQKNGLAPLALDSSISNVARIKSKDMSDNNYFAHQSPTYGSAGDMLTQHGIRYSAWGENIAAGQRTPEEVVSAWMNSPGHRANILASHFTKIGVGYVNNGRPHWTQMFTN
jgi:uncharacterized YkwD family protein